MKLVMINEIRVIIFATLKDLTVKFKMFLQCSINNKCTWTSPNEKTHIQIDSILIDKRRHTIVLDVRYLREADCGANRYEEIYMPGINCY
jgi:hypothetical protein